MALPLEVRLTAKLDWPVHNNWCLRGSMLAERWMGEAVSWRHTRLFIETIPWTGVSLAAVAYANFKLRRRTNAYNHGSLATVTRKAKNWALQSRVAVSFPAVKGCWYCIGCFLGGIIPLLQQLPTGSKNRPYAVVDSYIWERETGFRVA